MWLPLILSLPVICRLAGADPGFSNRGGAQNYVHAAHIPNAKRAKSLTDEIQGPLKGPASSRSLEALS